MSRYFRHTLIHGESLCYLTFVELIPITKLIKTKTTAVNESTHAASPEKPIFIIGGGRSGTTLARYILNAHPNIYIAEEIAYHSWMGMLKGNFEKRLNNYFRTFSYIWLRQDPHRVLEQLPTPLTRAHFGLAYAKILKLKAAQYGRRRWGEKNPLLTTQINRLYDDFPDARIINVIRDPRANVYSHSTMPWSAPSLIISNFLASLNYKIVKKHGDRILNIKLEDLIADPRKAIATILDFVEEPWSDRLLDHAKYTLKDEGIPFPWLSEAARSRKSKSKRWSDGLSPAWIRMIESANREQMERFGYPIADLDASVGAWDKLLAMAQDVPKLGYSIYRSLRMMFLMSVTRPENTWEIQEIMHSLNPRAWEKHPDWDPLLKTMKDADIYREPVVEGI